MENYIDTETMPHCKIEEKKFEWGEPYEMQTPVFIFKKFSASKLENSIILFGENNFKQQLLSLFNVIINHEEFERIENYSGEQFDRKTILELINSFIKKTESLVAPWEKYRLGFTEYDYVGYIEEQGQESLCYVKIQ
ncbi:hypothetical protein [Chryseobacterium sp. BIGb0232]|uniref:hypothetical protein n=1 Tax=Chryseobacterium sp. BIGb0232 TaxID=2940598 RepID=UPI000F474A22|nr:hypothetical protein [Chryseobacterium sp. BIGb0232]MCS4302468.1 transcription elongation factor [Chryseobacterium sp. BIGb0232]ROS18410.1 hypothetical protein EDF65_2806 [Chryseobacterium nakagawai]